MSAAVLLSQRSEIERLQTLQPRPWIELQPRPCASSVAEIEAAHALGLPVFGSMRSVARSLAHSRADMLQRLADDRAPFTDPPRGLRDARALAAHYW